MLSHGIVFSDFFECNIRKITFFGLSYTFKTCVSMFKRAVLCVQMLVCVFKMCCMAGFGLLLGWKMRIYMHFFFRLSERKRCQKERTPAVPVGLLRSAFRLNGRNSLRSDSLPFFTPARRPPLHARRSMPEAMRHQAVLCRDVACRVL